MPKIDLNQQLATIPPYINTHTIIKGDSKSVEKLENFQKEYRDFQLKKLQKTLLKEIDLFKRRKKDELCDVCHRCLKNGSLNTLLTHFSKSSTRSRVSFLKVVSPVAAIIRGCPTTEEGMCVLSVKNNSNCPRESQFNLEWEKMVGILATLCYTTVRSNETPRWTFLIWEFSDSPAWPLLRVNRITSL